MDDKLYNQLYKYLSSLQFDLDISNAEKSRIQKESKNYLIQNEKLFRRNKDKPQR
ncbi:9197_t:CDS:1, partial [Ambispora leptoticha]